MTRIRINPERKHRVTIHKHRVQIRLKRVMTDRISMFKAKIVV